MTATTLRRTPIYESHKRLGGKLVDFHGWELPVQYEGIIKEHLAVRERCGFFDVSHMGQVFVEGEDSRAFLEKVNTNDIGRLVPGKAVYSHLPNERGGVVDDVIVSCLGARRYLVVVNAATADKDFAWFKRQAQGMEVRLANRSDEYGMIAVQGPKAGALAAADFPAVASMKRFCALEIEVFGQRSFITTTGYTGEDGLEFIVPAGIAGRLWDDLLSKGRSSGAAPCGLGARDTLRLEAGYLLYGQDIDDDHSSLEAGYGWVVKFDKGDFLGRSVLVEQRDKGLKRKMTGVRLLEKGVPRPGCSVLAGDRRLGSLTSATYSPSLQAGIGMGYLDGDVPVGARLSVELYGRRLEAEAVKTPFYRRGHAET
ncbi:MAG: glycine cleavage system aminomethyltransferase GcvT [Elusimicrobia bacterium]|nr:glycine cleavage system aminomethyltransferase GcvT [Elusimicrobiota bacterium]